METLKTHEFVKFQNCFHEIGERMEVTPMISLDPKRCLPFWISIKLSLTRSND